MSAKRKLKVVPAPEHDQEHDELPPDLPETLASDIVAVQPNWFWKDRLEWETTAFFQGAKGAGKSSWLRKIAAYVTGGPLLFGMTGKPRKPAHILWFAGEEDLKYKVRPGLERAGANLDLCHLFDLSSEDEQDNLALPRDCDRLVRKCKQHAARLVVIDPIFSFSDGTHDLERSTVEQRRFMTRLQRVCKATGALLLMSRNLTKDTSRGAVAAGRGGGELGNAARSVMHCQELPDKPKFFGLAVAICNNGAPCPTVGYHFDAHDGYGVVVVDGGIDYSADDLVSGDEGNMERYSKDCAKRLIMDMLPKGRMNSQDIKSVAEAAMIRPGTLLAAAKALGITYERKGSRENTECWWIAPAKGYPGKKKG